MTTVVETTGGYSLLTPEKLIRSSRILSQVLKAVRIFHKLTQADLSAKTGMGKKQVSTWEMGDGHPRGNVSNYSALEKLIVLAKSVDQESMDLAKKIPTKKNASGRIRQTHLYNTEGVLGGTREVNTKMFQEASRRMTRAKPGDKRVTISSETWIMELTPEEAVTVAQQIFNQMKTA